MTDDVRVLCNPVYFQSAATNAFRLHSLCLQEPLEGVQVQSKKFDLDWTDTIKLA